MLKAYPTAHINHNMRDFIKHHMIMIKDVHKSRTQVYHAMFTTLRDRHLVVATVLKPTSHD